MVKVTPLVHIKKLTYLYFYCYMAPHITPSEFDMGHKSFTIKNLYHKSTAGVRLGAM